MRKSILALDTVIVLFLGGGIARLLPRASRATATVVVAIAALKPGQSLTVEALREFASESLARYKLPGRLEIVAALPRNATGKILKYQLRQTFAKAQAAE